MIHLPIIVACIIWSNFLSSCSGDATGPRGLSPDKINGAWSFDLAATDACTTESGAQRMTFYVTLEMRDSTSNIASTWTNDPTTPDKFALIGTITKSSGAADLKFWQSVSYVGVEITGTMDAGGTFTGSAIDPIPGYRPFLSSDGCPYSVVGRKTS